MGETTKIREVIFMHMADALISPATGGIMLAAAAGTAAYSIKKIRNELDEKKIPLMGVMGAFVFAAQMINFSIPGTGSSGHLGGGLLLSVLLGPYAAFLVMSSILLIQALFFGDGGLLAYGCNVVNLGFFTSFVAYPYIYKMIVKKGLTQGRIFSASIFSAIVALQLGSLSVVLQTVLSGKTELPFTTFLLLMQPVHLAISIVEGLVTAAVVVFIWKARPEILEKAHAHEKLKDIGIKRVLLVVFAISVVIAGVFSWFASSDPDGLEWSIFKTSGKTELMATGKVHAAASELQNKTAILPDYGFRNTAGEENTVNEENSANKENTSNEENTAGKENSANKENTASGENKANGENAENEENAVLNEKNSPVSLGTSVSGIAGIVMTLAFIALTGFLVYIIKRR